MKIIRQTDIKATVLYKGKYYVVSQSLIRPETLVFPSNEQGEITSWTDVGGGSSISLDEVLEDFESYLY